MSSFIPQTDPHPDKRAAALQTAQRNYQFNYTHVSPLAIVDRVPIHDEFSFSWLMHVGERVLTVLANRAELATHPYLRDHHLSNINLLRRLIDSGETAVRDVRQLVQDALKFHGRVGAEPVHADALEDFADLFRKIGLPPVAAGYQEDRAFAWMRVAGPNPIVLQHWSQPDDRFPVTDAHLRISITQRFD